MRISWVFRRSFTSTRRWWDCCQGVSAEAAVTSAVVNGNSSALAGVQRSMVNSLVYTFNHAVTLAAGAFNIALHANVTVNGRTGQTAGVLPTLGYSTSDGRAPIKPGSLLPLLGRIRHFIGSRLRRCPKQERTSTESYPRR